MPISRCEGRFARSDRVRDRALIGQVRVEVVIEDGLVFTVEPFLSLGARFAHQKSRDDAWTLVTRPAAPTVQYEHTVVATPRGALVVTLAS